MASAIRLRPMRSPSLSAVLPRRQLPNSPQHRPQSKTMAHKILTTHVGSLPRNKQVTDLVFAKEAGVPIEEAGFNDIIKAAVNDIVAMQKAAGIDLPSDGEMSKISYATYIKDRLTGFDGDSSRRPPADLELFANFLRRQASTGGTPSYRRP